MQIPMKFKATISIRASKKNASENARGKNASSRDANGNVNSNLNGNSNGSGNLHGNGDASLHHSPHHFCSDCKVNLVRQQMEFVCPNCGIVEELIEGSE